MDIKIKFGLKLKKIRNEKNLSQEKLAELSSMDRSYLSNIERGKKNISLEKINELSKALQIDISKLFELEENKDDF